MKRNKENVRRTIGYLLPVALLLVLAGTSCKKKKEYKGEGKQVFNSKGCVACHGFGTGDKPTGPDLKGVTERRKTAWLKAWLADPPAMLKSDPIAKKLLKKFNGVAMPKTPLTSKEIDQIIDYLSWMDKHGGKAKDFKPLDDDEFTQAKKIFFNRCSGCHGAKRWGATGPSLLPKTHIVKAKQVEGGGTRSKGTEALEAILFNGTPGGMPAWGKEGILNKAQINLMARYIQMDPPEIPKLGMAEMKKNWKLKIPMAKRPKKDMTGGAFRDYFGVVMRDAGKVAIINGKTKKKLAVINTGFAVHILRSSHSGRYFYSIGRDGKVTLIDLWFKKPKLVAEGRTCWDARSIDGSKAPGYYDKYAIVGCYTPGQYAIMDGQTLEPLSVTSVSDSKDWSTGNELPEVRIAAIVASEEKPFWVVNLKESGWVYLVNYTNPKKPKETRLKANNFLHDGGWVNLPGEHEKRYFLVAANAKNEVCVVDTKAKEVLKPCVDAGKVPHPGRGANVVHPKYGPVWATSHIGDDKIVFIGVDPKGHPKHAWKVVDEVKIKSAGSLFVKSHPKSDHLWFDMPLSAQKGVNGQVGVYNMKTGKLKYLNVSPKRVVHFEYNRAGNEVWISGWLENAIYVYNDKNMKRIARITGDWVFTPTGKFNVTNTSKDIY